MYSILKKYCFLNIKSCQHILLHQIHKIMIFKIASYNPFNIFVEVVIHLFSGYLMNIKYLFVRFCNIINVFTDTFDLCIYVLHTPNL